MQAEVQNQPLLAVEGERVKATFNSITIRKRFESRRWITLRAMYHIDGLIFKRLDQRVLYYFSLIFPLFLMLSHLFFFRDSSPGNSFYLLSFLTISTGVLASVVPLLAISLKVRGRYPYFVLYGVGVFGEGVFGVLLFVNTCAYIVDCWSGAEKMVFLALYALLFLCGTIPGTQIVVLGLAIPAAIIEFAVRLIGRQKMTCTYQVDYPMFNKETFQTEAVRLAAGLAGACQICLQEMVEGEFVVRLSCHRRDTFHLECLQKSFLRNGTCPVCREDVRFQHTGNNEARIYS